MDLSLNLLASIVLIVVVTIVHGSGVTLAGKLLKYEEGEFSRRSLLFVEFHFLVPMALFLFGLHLVEIAIFASFYMIVGAIGTVEDALYTSAAAYATLGLSEHGLAGWRLVGAFEGLAGFLMIGWSVAVFIAEMDKVVRK
ncbi:hypothetical protein [Sphingomonas sp.]|uniref:hypothetical protein n=1 Tax=Sphingomonas sp. TaxID=28214 RepID=UPI00180A8AF5|nr:hypothetical protein [Sphingomonas sp.]MBA3512091.1 hypothetical protein [Sphingomonas sp.]